MNLTTAIGRALQNQGIVQPRPGFQTRWVDPPARFVQPPGSLRTPQLPAEQPLAASGVSKPVFQLSYFPIVIDPSDYADPHSNTNPAGSYLSLYAFHQLVDPIPTFAKYYSPGSASTEMVYGNLVNGASVIPGSEYTRQVIGAAQERYANSSLSNLSGIPGTWHPAYATPEDWWDASRLNRFRLVNLNLADLGAEDGPYTILNGNQGSQELAWRIGAPEAAGATVQRLDSKTKLKALSFKCLEVSIRRTAWLDYQIFQTPGWYLEGQAKGFCSTGTTSSNQGVLPLLPISFIVAVQVEISADWSVTDRSILEMATNNREFVALGPFAFSSGRRQQPVTRLQPHLTLPINRNAFFRARFKNFTTISSPAWNIIAWISDLVPLSPQAENPATSLAVPQLVAPAAGAVFDHYPRTTELQWMSVPGAASYTVEIDCYHCCAANAWCTDLGKTWMVIPHIRTTNHIFQFVGAQPGRWRVWAVDHAGREGSKSEWREFRYTQ